MFFPFILFSTVYHKFESMSIFSTYRKQPVIIENNGLFFTFEE